MVDSVAAIAVNCAVIRLLTYTQVSYREVAEAKITNIRFDAYESLQFNGLFIVFHTEGEDLSLGSHGIDKTLSNASDAINDVLASPC